MRQEYCKAKFLTVLSDGSTELQTVLFWNKKLSTVDLLMKAKCWQFLALQSVKKADAVNIAAAIDTVASQTLSKDWKDKLVALGTDGASVMLGRQNGVVAKL